MGVTTSFLLLTVRNKDGSAFDRLPTSQQPGPPTSTAVPANREALGYEEFREKLEELAEEVVKGKRRESYAGEVLKRHDTAEAQRILESGLERMGLKLVDVRGLKQNDPRKQGLCWLVKSQTVVRDEWIQAALTMGDRSNISRAVSAYRQESTKEVRKWKRRLHICTD